MKIPGWAIIAGLVILGAGGWFLCRPNLPKEQTELENTFTADTAHFASDTLETDRVLTRDSVKPTTRAAVKKERKAATKALTTSRKQIKNLNRQLQGGWLKVFGEADYEIPSGTALLKGTTTIKAGVMLRLRPGTFVQGYVQQPITGEGERSYHIGVRQEIRIF